MYALKRKGQNLLKKHLFGIIYGILLASFTVYLLLDSFVIARVYETVPPKAETSTDISNDSELGAESNREEVSTVVNENTYSDGDITVTITEYREYDTAVYVADIKLSSPEYLKTAFAKNSYGKNITEKTSDMAKNNNAIIAINGDFYGARQSGFVLRNGRLWRIDAAEDREALVIYKDGSFEIVTEEESNAEALAQKGAMQILSFGPMLVNEGEIQVDENDEVGQAMRSNPRTAIGIVDDLHYVFVVSDGRTKESAGLSLKELARFMQSLNVKIAYNLDGGGSATMYFDGEVVNNPTTNGSIKERKVSDIVYIGR